MNYYAIIVSKYHKNFVLSSVYPTVFYPHLRTIFWSSCEDKSATFLVYCLRKPTKALKIIV